MRARVHLAVFTYTVHRGGEGEGSLSSPVGVQRTRIQDADPARLQGRQIAAPDAAAKAERAAGQRATEEGEGRGRGESSGTCGVGGWEKGPCDLKCRSRRVIRHCLGVCDEFAYVLQCARSSRLLCLPPRRPRFTCSAKE